MDDIKAEDEIKDEDDIIAYNFLKLLNSKYIK